MFEFAKKILIPSMETILVISCYLLLATGLPASDPAEQEIKLGAEIPAKLTARDCKGLDHPECVNILLQTFGYEKKPSEEFGEIVTAEAQRQAIIRFQDFYKLPETGIADEVTKKYLTAERCGVPDMDEHQRDTKRKKRFALNGSKWNGNELTWCINDADLSPDMTKDGQIAAIEQSFQMWADVSRLTFSRVTGDCRRAVIQIKFARGSHGDNDPFDGEHGTLAHAYFPRFGGDAHFDDDERWSLTTTRGGRKLFVPIATHEFGHSLGLGHSRDDSAIMYALYFSSSPVVKLQPDDISGIQYLYQAPLVQPQPTQRPRPVTQRPQPTQRPVTQRPPTQAPPTQGPVGALCTNVPKLDAIVMMGSGYSFGFSGPYYWRMDTARAIDRVPILVSTNWFYRENNRVRGMPGNFDAVLFWPTEDCTPRCRGKTFFFSGSYVFTQSPQTQTNADGTSGEVKKELIRDVFPGLPNNIDAATLWTGNDRAYFFKGNEYYRVSANGPPYAVDQVNWPNQYPRSIDRHWDLGWQSIDSAVYYWHFDRPDIKKTYFFKGDQYVRYNDLLGEIDRNYPKETEVNWYGCSTNGFILDGDNMGDNEMTEHEMFTDTDVMDIEEIDIQTGMKVPPEEGDASSANIISSLMSSVVMMFIAVILL